MNIAPRGTTAMTTPADHTRPGRSSVFERWGRTAYRRRRLILVIALLVAVVGGVWGTTIFAKVQTAGGFDAPDSQSQHEADLATQAFGRDAGDVVVLYSSKTLTTASPAFRSAVTGTLAALPRSRGRVVRHLLVDRVPAVRQRQRPSDLRRHRAGRRHRHRPAGQLRRDQGRA